MCGTGTRTNRNELTGAELAWKRRVHQSFNAAVDEYSQNAQVQERIANSFFRWIEPVISGRLVPTALEIGCGTGFLTRLIAPALNQTDWTITDVAPEMVLRCSGLMEEPGRCRFQSLDGEHPDRLEGGHPFDLICSNLAFQWFVDLPTALARLVDCLKPDGMLLFSTLANDNFRQVLEPFAEQSWTWGNAEAAVRELGLQPGLKIRTEVKTFYDRWPGLDRFLRSLQQIGAGIPRSENRVDSQRLRAAIRDSRASSEAIDADYRILFVAIQKGKD